MKTSKYFSDNTVLVCTICVVVSFLSQIFAVSRLVNVTYAFSLLLVFICYLFSGYTSKLMLALIALVGFAALSGGMITSDMDFFSHVLITLCTFICIEIGAAIEIKPDTYKKISSMFFVMSVILLIAYYFGSLKTSYHSEWKDTIGLNFSNPNAAGLWLACIFVVLVYSSFLYEKFRRVAFWGVALAILPIIIATESRNSYIACLFFLIATIVVKFFKIKKVPNWVLLVLACLPIIVFFSYMFIVVENLDFWQELFSLDSIDKGLDSRVGVWQRVLDDFWRCFWVGDYKTYYTEQMHNSLMTIYCRFGALVTGLVCKLIYEALKTLQEKHSFSAALSLGAILFTGCFEASIFVGVASLYLMLLIVPACSAAEDNRENVLPQEGET